MAFGFAANFLVDVLILFVAFVICVYYCKGLSRLFLKIPLPRFLIYLIASLPFMLFEENINCPPTGCVLFPETIPALLIFMLVLGLVVRWLKLTRFWAINTGFAVFGFLFEVFFGYGKGSFSLNPVTLLFSIFWVYIGYTIFSIVPLTILLKREQ